jgi:hypothetical protein
MFAIWYMTWMEAVRGGGMRRLTECNIRGRQTAIRLGKVLQLENGFWLQVNSEVQVFSWTIALVVR